MSGPPTTPLCVSCRHPAHGGRVCGAATFFTRTCGCRLSTERTVDPDDERMPWHDEQGRNFVARQDAGLPPDPPDHDDLADARFYHEHGAEFDERKAFREEDAPWYGDDRD